MAKPRFFLRDATGLTRQLSMMDALIANVAGMGIGYVLVDAFFGTLLYPGVNLPATAIFGILPGVVISLVYYMFIVAMPRTGGDYVWVSRVIHPLVGFVCNFIVTFALISFVGSDAVWLVVYGLSPMLAGIGLINGNAGLISTASALTVPLMSFVLAAVIMSVFVLLTLAGTKTTFRFLWVITAISIVGTLVMVGAFFSAPNSVFISNFNSLSGMNYAKTLATAGLAPGFSLNMTLTGSIFTLLGYIGFNFSAYYTGEVKQVKKSQIIAMLGGFAVIVVLTYTIYASVYYSVGADFLAAFSNLGGTGSAYYTAPAPPMLNFLVTFAVPNVWVVALSSLALIATTFGSFIVFTFISVRNMFAWSFDRILPSQIIKLNSRGSPYVAILVTWLAELLVVYLYVYTTFFSYLIYIALTFFIVFAVVSLSAIWFPFRRKDIFGQSPDLVKKTIGRIPVISILGVIGFIVSAFLAIATVQPAVTAPPSGPILVQVLSYVFVPLTIIAGVIIYGIAAAYRRKEGIDMSLAFREIPPE